MLTKEDLQMLRAIIKEELEPVNERLDRIENDITTMKEDIAEIKENAEITREATNYLLDLVEGRETAIKKLM